MISDQQIMISNQQTSKLWFPEKEYAGRKKEFGHKTV
jgi:hypothetical protein